MELKEWICRLSAFMSVTGYEDYSAEELRRLTNGLFDEYHIDALKNQVLVKKCGRENAPRLLVDTHFDEIGMYVSDIKEGGFLSVTNVGGLDTRILEGAPVMIFGKEVIFGVIAATPAHLIDEKEKDKLKKIDQLLIDTGYTEETLHKLVRVGTPVGYYGFYSDLGEYQMAGKGFDDKACAACAVYALSQLGTEELAGDVYLMLSAHEETDRLGGIFSGAYAIDPDYAMVIDVNLGKTPDTKSRETVKMGGGASVTLSAVTDKHLTRMTCELAEQKGIAYQKCVSADSTGTNATSLVLVREGVPTVDVGLPLKSMHTYNEVLDLRDATSLSQLVSAFVTSRDIAQRFERKGGEKQ